VYSTLVLALYFTFTYFPNVYLVSGKEPLHVFISILLGVSIDLVKAGGGGSVTVHVEEWSCLYLRAQQSNSESLCTEGNKFRMSLFFIVAVLVVFLRRWRKICTILQLMGSKRRYLKKSTKSC
jgi:hypothetical protein